MRIVGTVKNSRNNAPVQDARVDLSINSTEIISISSNESGYFEYTLEIEGGEQFLKLIIEKEGFSRKSFSYKMDQHDIQIIAILDEIDVEIKGRISCDEADRPIENANITLKIGEDDIKTVVSDSEGSFSFSVPQYYLNKHIKYKAVKKGYKIKSEKVRLNSDKKFNIDLSKEATFVDIKEKKVLCNLLDEGGYSYSVEKNNIIIYYILQRYL